MRVYVSVDMEGIAGVGHPGPTDGGDPAYPEAVDLMTGDPPVVLEVDYHRPIEADYAAVVPGVERVGDRGIRIDAPDAVSAYRGFLAGLRLASLVD